MRRDLVEEVLAAASEELFEDVVYTPPGGEAVTAEKAIFGVELLDERFELFGERLRGATHVTRALKAKLPGIGKGAIINDGTAYKVLDVEKVGDGRYEILIALEPV
jgi:hypothetical protein